MKVIFLLLTFLLSACTEKKIEKEFENSVKAKDEFLQLDVEKTYLLKKQEPKKSICQKANVKASKLDLRVLGLTLAKTYDVNINVPNNVEQYTGQVFNIDLNLENICLDQLLEELTDAYNIGFVKSNNRYTIYPPEVRAKSFYVNYHSLQRSSSSNSSVNSRSLDNSNNRGQNYVNVQTKSEDNFWENIKSAIAIIIKDDNPFSEKSFDPKNMIAIYKDSGVIVVRAEPRALKNVDKFVQRINRESLRQVVIEAKILEVELKNQYSTGINWTKFANQLTLTSNAVVNENSAISSLLTATIGSSASSFDGAIELLASQGKVSVLSSPRVAALNNQRALIKFGTDSYYITDFSNNFVPNTTTSANGTTTTNNSMQVSNVTFQPFFSGIALDTTAKIINDKEVLLHVHPMITRVEEVDKIFTLNSSSSTVPMANINTREADTLVKANSGDIVIIGGLTQNQVNMTESGFPAVKDKGIMRLLSFFTKSKQKYNTKTELVILLKPTIVESLQTTTDFDSYLEE
ncbi:MAG: hypothetical protein K9G11_02460 [Rickettsiaceae bacterium]|nr:hypothetical protein [Rickettsiaceae bacterium]